MNQTLTVCICTRNRPTDVRRTVASVQAADPPVAAIVVSDDSTDERTQSALEGLDEGLSYSRGPRRGLSANRNTALTHVSTSHVAFLDDDALLAADFVRSWRSALAKQPRGEQARTILTGGERKHGELVLPHAQSFLGHQSRPYRPGEPLSTVVINATVFPSTLFDIVRFDESLVYGYEEADIAMRAVQVGYPIIAASGLVNDHFPSPVNRDYYAPHVESARLYVTWKRYADVERAPLKASTFALVASGHLMASGARRHGLRGAARELGSIRRACAMAWGNRSP